MNSYKSFRWNAEKFPKQISEEFPLVFFFKNSRLFFWKPIEKNTDELEIVSWTPEGISSKICRGIPSEAYRAISCRSY